jgi:hypothetical protein
MIAPEQIDRIALVVERAGLSQQTLSALRESFADLHFTYCMDEDIGDGIDAAAPVRVSPGFKIYLVDGRSHCMRLTADLESATGLVLAELDTESESAGASDPDAGRTRDA